MTSFAAHRLPGNASHKFIATSFINKCQVLHNFYLSFIPRKKIESLVGPKLSSHLLQWPFFFHIKLGFLSWKGDVISTQSPRKVYVTWWPHSLDWKKIQNSYSGSNSFGSYVASPEKWPWDRSLHNYGGEYAGQVTFNGESRERRQIPKLA